MTKEISKEVIAKVFALYYECQCVYTNIMGNFYSDVNYDVLRRLYTQPSFSPKLILSDLSDISDEDLIDVSRVAGLSDDEIDSFDNINEESKKAWAANIDDLLYPMADFLRSRGYMLPAFGITDLFEAGIAVRKNKEV